MEGNAMTHEKMKEKLCAYYDRELLADEEQLLRRHLETCSECRDEVDEWRRMDQLLVFPAQADTEEFVAKIMARLPRPKANTANKWIVDWGWQILALAGAAASLLVLIGRQPRETPPSLDAVLVGESYDQTGVQLFLQKEAPKTEELVNLLWRDL
jgi:anti-sigma factor RsiW